MKSKVGYMTSSTRSIGFARTLMASTVGVGLMMTMQSAQAFLVDSSQQKVVYIGKGNEGMKAVKVQEIRSTQPSVSVQSANQGFTNHSYQQPSYTQEPVTYQQQPYQYSQPQHYGTQSHSTPSYGATNYSASFDQLPISTSSAAVAVMDLQTGQTIYQKNVDSRRSIASITKVMTAMVLMDAGLDMREEITLIGSDLVGAKKASTNLKAGDRMSRSEFMLMMLMKSENPAAKALARTYPGGYDAFIAAMNQKAQSLGMYQTAFSDSSGLNPRNVSSATDLLKMMRTINADPRYHVLRSYSIAPSYDFYINNYNAGSRTYKANNTNRLVRAGSYPIGLSKTGFIREAGYCVVMETHVNNRPAVVVILGAGASNSRWNDAENILTQLAYRN